jgi:hypothetical protein
MTRRSAWLARLFLVAGLLVAPHVAARELTPEELRRMPRPDELPAQADAPEEEEAEPLPVTAHRWPRPGKLRGALLLGAFGAQPRWRVGLGGRPSPRLGWSVEAYHRIESPDAYGLRVAGAWRSAPGLLLKGGLGREVLGRDGAEAELTALGAWRLGALTLFVGPSAGARLSSAPYGVAGAAALLQWHFLTLRHDSRLQWTRLHLEGASHQLQLGWTSPQGLFMAARALRTDEPPDVPHGPRWFREEVSVLLDAPVTSELAVQLQAPLGRRFEPALPPPALSLGWELGLALSF